MSIAEFETAIKEAVAEKRITGAAIAGVYKTKQGTKHYLDAFGKESPLPDSKDISPDSLLWIASCTKLLTAISALQVVERGLITLDEPLTNILPELAPPLPLVSLDPTNNALTTTTSDRPLTLRLLLTHTAGFAYDHHPALRAWKAGLPASDPRHASHQFRGEVFTDYRFPVVYEPGAPDRWEYGPALDFAGKVVERVNAEKLTLGAHMAKYIFAPLGISDSTFRPLADPATAARLFPRSARLADGSLGVDAMEHHAQIEPVDECGGGGLYSTARDYVRVLESLLLDDGKLLRPASVDELFRPQLDPNSAALKAKFATHCDDARAAVMETDWEGHAEKADWNWSLCGLSAGRDVPGKFAQGAGLWSGLANCYWWVDRKHGTAGFYGSQVFPFGDLVSERLSEKFRKAMFEAAKV